MDQLCPVTVDYVKSLEKGPIDTVLLEKFHKKVGSMRKTMSFDAKVQDNAAVPKSIFMGFSTGESGIRNAVIDMENVMAGVEQKEKIIKDPKSTPENKKKFTTEIGGHKKEIAEWLQKCQKSLPN
jgi:hypothetical protein